eukprot:9730279-Heterocapsa_arctica.AAC.1
MQSCENAPTKNARPRKQECKTNNAFLVRHSWFYGPAKIRPKSGKNPAKTPRPRMPDQETKN